MRKESIKAYKDSILVRLSGVPDQTPMTVSCRVPLVCGPEDPSFVPGREIVRFQTVTEEGGVSIPRFIGEYDLLLCRFEIEGAEGVSYVTEVDDSVPRLLDPFPKLPIKAIDSGALEEDWEEMGFRQTGFGPNQAGLMVSKDGEDVIPYVYNGKTYYFNKSTVEACDNRLAPLAARGVTAVMRYINSSFFLGEKADQTIVDIIQHPGYDYDFPSAYMGAFNLRTEEGFEYFAACTDFLLNRYTMPGHPYGWATAFEVGNEVTSQYIWGNAGEMTCAEYMKEYTEVMRICWLLSQKYWNNFRIYTSFDQYFCGSHMPDKPKRFYGMRESLDEILKNCARDGDFPWNVAFHPYPENLSYPDFWNDRSPNWSFETVRITFKNLEVMPAYLAQPEFLYKGEPRRIILPEQGFNSRTEAPYTLDQAKYAYVLAYQKMKKLGTIDLFLHHNYVDNPYEFGLNLGIRYCAVMPDGTLGPGERKPICDAIAAMDTPREESWVAAARAYIGEDIFDYLLDPPEVAVTVDHSSDGLTMPGQGNRKKGQGKEEKPVGNFEK